MFTGGVLSFEACLLSHVGKHTPCSDTLTIILHHCNESKGSFLQETLSNQPWNNTNTAR